MWLVIANGFCICFMLISVCVCVLSRYVSQPVDTLITRIYFYKNTVFLSEPQYY